MNYHSLFQFYAKTNIHNTCIRYTTSNVSSNAHKMGFDGRIKKSAKVQMHEIRRKALICFEYILTLRILESDKNGGKPAPQHVSAIHNIREIISRKAINRKLALRTK